MDTQDKLIAAAEELFVWCSVCFHGRLGALLEDALIVAVFCFLCGSSLLNATLFGGFCAAINFFPARSSTSRVRILLWDHIVETQANDVAAKEVALMQTSKDPTGSGSDSSRRKRKNANKENMESVHLSTAVHGDYAGSNYSRWTNRSSTLQQQSTLSSEVVCWETIVLIISGFVGSWLHPLDWNVWWQHWPWPSMVLVLVTRLSLWLLELGQKRRKLRQFWVEHRIM